MKRRLKSIKKASPGGKVVAPKRSTSTKRRPAPTGQETETARLARERDEALAREKAVAEVLRVISSSAGELESVFQAILENAVRICKATFGNLYLREDDGFRAVAMYNAPPGYTEKRAGILHPSPNSVIAKATTTNRPPQTADITNYKRTSKGIPG
jgi:hypothetical protein